MSVFDRTPIFAVRNKTIIGLKSIIIFEFNNYLKLEIRL